MKWCNLWRVTASLLVCAIFALAGCGTSSYNLTGSGTSERTSQRTANSTAPTGGASNTSGTNIPSAPSNTPSTSTPTPPPIPNIAGTYTGSFTRYGQAGSSPMQISIIQSGPTLSGTTTEGPAVSRNTGTIFPTGSFTITEIFSGGGIAYLGGSRVSSGHLSGTWSMGSNPLGTWDVIGG